MGARFVEPVNTVVTCEPYHRSLHVSGLRVAMGSRWMVFFDWKVLLEVLTALAVLVWPAWHLIVTKPFFALVPAPGTFLSGRRKFLSETPGRTRQSIPRSKVSTPPVHVRYATVEVSDSKNRALSPTRFAYRYIIAFHYSSLRSKHEILPILNVRTRLTPRFQTPQRRQFRSVSLRTTRRCRETGADRVAENRLLLQAFRQSACETDGRNSLLSVGQ